jgi:hypothetical protein
MNTDRMDRLIANIKDSLEKAETAVAELQALTAGDNPTYQTMKHWQAKYSFQYGIKYEFSKVDTGNLKRLALKYGAADMQARIDRYLADADDFLIRQRHPLSIFLTRINTYAPQTSTAAFDMAAIPVDCRHSPRCRTDQEHTRKKTAELRA